MTLNKLLKNTETIVGNYRISLRKHGFIYNCTVFDLRKEGYDMTASVNSFKDRGEAVKCYLNLLDSCRSGCFVI